VAALCIAGTTRD